jgi:hypothetical protein
MKAFGETIADGMDSNRAERSSYHHLENGALLRGELLLASLDVA